jgi:hypothetical protein
MKAIESPRIWEFINYILEESNLKQHRDTHISLTITTEDVAWIILQSLFESIELEVYQLLDNAPDKDLESFKLYKTKCMERFKKFFDICDQIGIKKESIIEIAQMRTVVERAELNSINELISQLSPEDDSNDDKA